MSERKKSRRRTQATTEVSFNSPEVVHIEHNFIVHWLLQLKHWFRKNKSFLQNLLLISFIALAIGGVIIFLYSSLAKKQNYLFFKYMNEFNEFKELKPEEEKKQKLTRLLDDVHKLCYTSWKTSHSYNACLIEAAVLIQLDQPEKASKPLELFGQENGDNGAGAYALFFAAQMYENLLDFDQAYQIYHQLEEILKPIKKDDIALFNRGKVLYLQDKLKLSEQVFEEILDRFPNSKLSKDVYSFLNLIAFKRSEELFAQKPIPPSPPKE